MSNFYIKSGDTSGSGNSDIVISTSSQNNGRESLKGRFRVSFDNNEYATISLEQIGVGNILNMSRYTQRLSANESVVTISGTANVSTIATSIAGSIRVNGNVISNWNGVSRTFITGDPGKISIYDYIITIDVGTNTSSYPRNINIILSDGNNITKTLNISQDGNGSTPGPPLDKYMYFSRTTINFTSNGGVQTSSIMSNVNWRLST
jgi:hypothetical protein|uniref:Uncharacterized protein n=1 Tax=CrAss-like virus sp. ctelJ1 TaxID=2825838 RepID=A0A8S5V2H8_9CAUD|nr:MAG TPA: hypothetical protein [CrAss-like virus sp. ctelJ1]